MALQPLWWAASVLLTVWSCLVAAQDDIKEIPIRTHSLVQVR